MQTIEGVFAKRSTTEQYLANAYAYLPEQYDAVCIVPPMYGWPFVPASDEAEWGAGSGVCFYAERYFVGLQSFS